MLACACKRLATERAEPDVTKCVNVVCSQVLLKNSHTYASADLMCGANSERRGAVHRGRIVTPNRR